MNDFDPSFLPPVPSEAGEKTITACNGQTFDVALCVTLGGEEGLALYEIAEEHLSRFGPEGLEKIQPDVRHPAVKVTSAMAYSIAEVMLAEVKPSSAGENWTPRSFSWWAILWNRDKDAWAQVRALLSELKAKASATPEGEGDGEDDPLKNA
jgi:hypothetical protein